MKCLEPSEALVYSSVNWVIIGVRHFAGSGGAKAFAYLTLCRLCVKWTPMNTTRWNVNLNTKCSRKCLRMWRRQNVGHIVSASTSWRPSPTYVDLHIPMQRIQSHIPQLCRRSRLPWAPREFSRGFDEAIGRCSTRGPLRGQYISQCCHIGTWRLLAADLGAANHVI